MATIYYAAPNNDDKPSWGLGIIYHHVSILCKAGLDAYIIKEKNLTVPEWLNLNVPVRNQEYLKNEIKEDDILVVPEVMMDFPNLKKIKCKKILFAQASAFLFESMPKGEDHISLGFEHVFIIMSHMTSIIENHVKLPYTIIPPFVADYFFTNDLSMKRQRQILIYPKFHQIDYSIVKYLIERHVNENNKHWVKDIFRRENWKVKELKNLTHEETAKEMKNSTFFISLNVFEALNTSVVEAMAAGCVVFTYEGFGPKDYLKNNENAIVFNNNEAYKLVEKLCEWMDKFEANESKFTNIQREGNSTAKYYAYNNCQKALLQFFESK